MNRIFPAPNVLVANNTIRPFSFDSDAWTARTCEPTFARSTGAYH